MMPPPCCYPGLVCLLLLGPFLPVAAGAAVAAEPPVAAAATASAQADGDPREVFQRSGVNSFDKGALSNIVMRGYQRENLQFIFDGALYAGAAPFRTDAGPVLINTGVSSRIVVTKGPYNLTLPGALGGSVEMKSADNPKRLSARTTFSYNNFNAVDGSVVAGFGTQRADLSLGYRGRSSGVPEAGDGVPLLRTPYPNSNNNYRPGAEDQQMYTVHHAWIKGGVDTGSDSRLELSYALLYGEEVKVPTQNFDVSEEQVHRAQGQWVVRNINRLVQELKLQAWGSYARTAADDRWRETADPANIKLPYRSFLTRNYAMSNRFEAVMVGARAVTGLEIGSGQLQAGVDWYQRSWNGSYSSLLRSNSGATPPVFAYRDDQTQIPDVTTQNIGLFVTFGMPLAERLRAVVAARGDLSRIDADGLTMQQQLYFSNYYPTQGLPGGRDFADWGANAQLFYQVRPELELYLKAGRANRLPDPHELYSSQVRQGSNLAGNPFLRQTVLHQGDIGAVWTAGGLRAELLAFYGTATDFILPVRLSPTGFAVARSAANIDADIWGIEFDGTMQLTPQLKAVAMVSYSEGRNNSNGRPLAEIPPLRGRLALRYDNRRFFAGISEVLVARQNRFDPTLGETSQPGYLLTNLQLGGRWNGFMLSVDLTNLFDVRYVMPLYYQRDPVAETARIPENGRTVGFRLSYRY